LVAKVKGGYEVERPTADDDTMFFINAYLDNLYGPIGSDSALKILLSLIKPDALPNQIYFATNRAASILELKGRVESHKGSRTLIDSKIAKISVKYAQNNRISMEEAMRRFMNSVTYESLVDTETGLFLEVFDFVYDEFVEEINSNG